MSLCKFLLLPPLPPAKILQYLHDVISLSSLLFTFEIYSVPAALAT